MEYNWILIVGFSIAGFFFLKGLYYWIMYRITKVQLDKIAEKNHYEATKAALAEYGIEYTPEQAKHTLDVIKSVVNRKPSKEPPVVWTQRIVENPDGSKKGQILANGEVHGEVYGVSMTQLREFQAPSIIAPCAQDANQQGSTDLTK